MRRGESAGEQVLRPVRHEPARRDARGRGDSAGPEVRHHPALQPGDARAGDDRTSRLRRALLDRRGLHRPLLPLPRLRGRPHPAPPDDDPDPRRPRRAVGANLRTCPDRAARTAGARWTARGFLAYNRTQYNALGYWLLIAPSGSAVAGGRAAVSLP